MQVCVFNLTNIYCLPFFNEHFHLEVRSKSLFKLTNLMFNILNSGKYRSVISKKLYWWKIIRQVQCRSLWHTSQHWFPKNFDTYLLCQNILSCKWAHHQTLSNALDMSKIHLWHLTVDCNQKKHKFHGQLKVIVTRMNHLVETQVYKLYIWKQNIC